MTYNHNPTGNYPFVDTEPKPDPNAVPAGTKREILDWVGADKKKAKRALEAENARATPRQTVIDALGKV